MTSSPKTFGKNEKLVSKRTIDALFSGGNSRSMSAYPLRVVFMRKERNETEEPAQVMVSVSKRHFKRAVKRNRVKRQIREAYRLNKHLLHEALEQKKDTAVAMAFIWQSDELAETALITEKMQSLLSRMAEKISR